MRDKILTFKKIGNYINQDYDSISQEEKQFIETYFQEFFIDNEIENIKLDLPIIINAQILNLE